MSEPVKRYGIHFAVEHMVKEDSTGEYVLVTDYASLEQECERLRVKLMTIASAEPARHNIEWAKAIAAEGNNEVYAKWRQAFDERDAALRQVDRLRAHLKLLLNGESGRWLLAKLDDGQGTELEDGKAWLAAREAISGD